MTLLGSVNDLDGELLEVLAADLPGGKTQAQEIDFHCSEDGAYGVFAEVTDAAGRKGTAWATGRISWHRLDPESPRPSECVPKSIRGGGCTTTPTRPPLSFVLLLLGVTLRGLKYA